MSHSTRKSCKPKRCEPRHGLNARVTAFGEKAPLSPPADHLGIGSLHLSHGERSQKPCVSPPGPPLPGSSATPSEQPYRLFPSPGRSWGGKKEKEKATRPPLTAQPRLGGARSFWQQSSASHQFSESGSGEQSGGFAEDLLLVWMRGGGKRCCGAPGNAVLNRFQAFEIGGCERAKLYELAFSRGNAKRKGREVC